MKNKRKRQLRQVLAALLCVCMIAPDVAPIVSYAAETIENMPRYVNFSRPKALMLSDLGLSTDSNAGFEDVIPEEKTETETKEDVLNNKVQSGGIQDDWILDEDELDGVVHLATDSDAEIRDPEFFYEDFPEEPDGILVDFSETSRTYLMEENIGVDETGEPIHSYVTIVGDSPYLYQTEDGSVQYYDNTLKPVSLQTKQISVASDSNIASGSNARRARKTKQVVTVTNYQNAGGKATIQIPDEMDSGNGYMISNGEDTIEIIPTEGEFKSSVTLENVIRYSNVFENVDFQYTVVGDSIKEDIILLEQQERNKFSYKLKSTGLKYKKVNNSVVAYKESYRKPIFRLTAPVMVDAAGVPSVDINVVFNKSSNEITFIADKDWLDDPERVYPVRIDPGATLVGYDAFSVNMVAKGDTPEFLGTNEVDPEIYNNPYGDDGHTMVGYSKDHGHCRAMILVDTEWEKLINHSATEVDGPGVKKVQMSFGVMTNDSPQRTPFILRIMDEPWDTSNITFANVCHKESTQTGDAQYSNGVNSRLEFDITDTYYQWVNGTKPRYGLMMEVEGENDYNPQNVESVWWAETLYNKNGAGNGPRIEVAWEGKLENVGDLSLLPMSEFSLDVGPGVIESEEGGRSTKGILAHGASQAGSSIDYQIYKKSGDEVIAEGNVEAHDEVDCPDYTEVDGDCIWEDHQDSNWQSDPVLYDAGLELDTIYYAKAKGTGYEIVEDPETGELMQGENEEESEELTSDEFLLYEVQATDIIPRIARHYGVAVETLKEDNKFHEQLTVTGDVLFIRNPQTDEPYTRRLTPDELEELLLECLSLGMDYRDFFGMEPVNMANGSFYMNQTDASIEDLGGSFNIERSYNSVTPYFRSDFGMGWSSLTNEKIMVLPGSTIIYVREDGKGIVFEKSGDKTYRAPEGYDYELEAIDSIEMKTENSDDASDVGKEDTEDETGELQSMGATPPSAARKKTAKQKTLDTDAGESETEAEETKVPASTGWQITQPDGTVKVFNSNGLLVTEKDRQGRTTYYVYDTSFLLKKIISPSEKEYEITQTPKGLITDILLPDGGELHYEYDEDDNLISVTNPEGDVKRFEYDDAHHMTAWYDENGTCVVTNTYDDKGRVVTQQDGLDNVSELSFSDGLTVVTDNRGNSTKYYMNDRRLATKVEYANGDCITRTYTDDGRIESQTDENGSTTSYTYDENGNVLSETRSDGSSALYEYNDLNLPIRATDYEGHSIRFTYDEIGNLLSMTDGEGNTTHYEYDELSRIVSIRDANGGTSTFAYDGMNAPVVTFTDPEGGSSEFTYDEMNRVVTETDPEGNTVEHAYNANGWEISTTAQDGGVTAYLFSPAGEVLSITDPMGVETTFTYDAMHNILSGKDGLGNTLTYAYDENYNCISQIDAKGNTTLYQFDVRDRMVQMTDAHGNSISYSLDGVGNILSVYDRRGNTVNYQYDPVLQVPVIYEDELGNESRYEYDRNGNLTRVIYPDGTSIGYAYDGAGRMIRMTAQNGLETELTYDGNGNIVRITDDETRVYRFEYDGNNRLVKTTDPLDGVTEFAYDGAGNQIQVTDANLHSTGYTYDPVGRLTEVRDALNGTVVSNYDLNGNTLSITDQNGHATTWHYDVIGQVLAQVDAAGNITAMEYDSLGNITKTTDALKGETTMELDALSRTVKMTDAMGGIYTYLYGNCLGSLFRFR